MSWSNTLPPCTTAPPPQIRLPFARSPKPRRGFGVLSGWPLLRKGQRAAETLAAQGFPGVGPLALARVGAQRPTLAWLVWPLWRNGLRAHPRKPLQRKGSRTVAAQGFRHIGQMRHSPHGPFMPNGRRQSCHLGIDPHLCGGYAGMSWARWQLIRRAGGGDAGVSRTPSRPLGAPVRWCPQCVEVLDVEVLPVPPLVGPRRAGPRRGRRGRAGSVELALASRSRSSRAYADMP
jgi:hypothetical protein